MSDYGQSLVNDAGQLLEGTWEYSGEEHELKVRNISYPDWKLVQEYAALAQSVETLGEKDEDEISEDDLNQLQEQAESLDDFSWENEDEDADFIVSVVGEKLVRPDVDVDETSQPVLVALIEGMLGAWQESDSVRRAKEEMPLDEGN